MNKMRIDKQDEQILTGLMDNDIKIKVISREGSTSLTKAIYISPNTNIDRIITITIFNNDSGILEEKLPTTKYITKFKIIEYNPKINIFSKLKKMLMDV